MHSPALRSPAPRPRAPRPAQPRGPLHAAAEASPPVRRLAALQRLAAARAAAPIQCRLNHRQLKELGEALAGYDRDQLSLAQAARGVAHALAERQYPVTDEHLRQVLGALGFDVGGAEAILERVLRALGHGPQETAPVETDEDRAARITSTDNGKAIGPFDGGRGNGKQVGAKSAVFYDGSHSYCISRDVDGHAGEDTWKLFKSTSTGWQRIDTLHPDGRRMGRG